MTDMQAAARRFITRVMHELELSPGALAKMAGIAPSTLTRFLNDANHKFRLSSTTIEKIASSTAMIPFELVEGVEESGSNIPTQTSPYVGRGTFVRGEVQPGVWMDFFSYKRQKSAPRHIPVLSSNWSPSQCFSVIVRGESINSIAADGDYLLCVDFAEFLRKHTLDEGDLVVLERADEELLRSELSARIVRWSEGGVAWREPGVADLHLASSDRTFKSDVVKGIRIDQTDPSAFTKVIGVVICVVRGTRFMKRA